MQTVDAQAQEIAKKEKLALRTFYCYEIIKILILCSISINLIVVSNDTPS